MRRLRPLLAVAAVAAVTAAALLSPGAFAGPAKVDPRLTVSAADRHDTSAPLRDLVTPWAPSPGTVVMEAGRKAMVQTPGSKGD